MYFCANVLLSKKDGLFYTGYTTNLKKRLKQHNDRTYKPKKYLFEGRNGMPNSGTSIGKIVAKAGKMVGVKTKVKPHTLRHSFATH